MGSFGDSGRGVEDVLVMVIRVMMGSHVDVDGVSW